MKYIKYLLVFIPAAILANLLGLSPLITLLAAALAIVPLAEYVGEGTEALAVKIGPRWGGLLNEVAVLAFLGVMAVASRKGAEVSEQGIVGSG